MAITKWIPFGGTQNSNSPAIPQPQEPLPVVTAADAKQFGLENFGNTCYANSVLQALYFCGPFRDLVVQYPDPSFPDVLLPPPALPLPPLSAPSPPPNHPRPNPRRKLSVSENSHQPPPSSCSATSPSTSGLPIPSSPPTLLSALRSLYIHISRNPADKGTVAPRAFIDKLKELNELFRSSMHQDAHEFLNYLLNQIVEEIDEDRRKANGNSIGNGNGSVGCTPSGEDLSASVGSLSSLAPPTSTASTSTTHAAAVFDSTLVHRLFEGVLTSETRCLTCETVSSRDECFLDLSIDIEQNSSVTACLRQFSASEMLCQKNKFFCDACCDLQEAEKRMKIKKLPNILALHLKRFKYQEDVGKNIKLTYRVAFPFELRLFNTVDDAENPDRLYELFAIVVHIGNGPYHGHYVSIVKARGTWYLFDDDSVEAIKESEIPKYFGESNAGSAYVLYYQAMDLDVTALGVRPPISIAPPATQSGDSNTGLSVASTAPLTSTSESPELDPTSPALPPGLLVHGTTPSPSPSPPTFTSPLIGSPPQSPPSQQPQLYVQIPGTSPESTRTPTSPPPPGGSSSRSSFFNSIRRPPSIPSRIRSGNGNSSENRKSVVHAPPVPPIPLAPGSGSSIDGEANIDGDELPIPALLPYGSPPSVVSSSQPNGKEKDKSWFKRKSFRSDKPPSSMAPDFAERSASASAVGEDTSSPWYKPTKRVMRRASEAGLSDYPSSIGMPSSAPTPSVMTHMSSASPSLRPVPEHKKSTPELAAVERSERRMSRQRPSTAGATVGRTSAVVVPPLPPIPLTPMRQPPSDQSSDKTEAPPQLEERKVEVPDNRRDRGQMNGAMHNQVHHRPHTSHSPISPSGLSFSASNGTSSTLGTNAGESTSTVSSTGATKPKRATRKLSLSAPMLGFGRKDKDKRPQSPATMLAFR